MPAAFAQAIGQYTAGRARTDDDVVEFPHVSWQHSSAPRRADPWQHAFFRWVHRNSRLSRHGVMWKPASGLLAGCRKSAIRASRTHKPRRRVYGSIEREPVRRGARPPRGLAYRREDNKFVTAEVTE